MKKIILPLIAVVFSIFSFGQSARYNDVMKTSIAKMDSTWTTDGLMQLANTFERIGNAEKTEWLPFYYAGYCLVMNAYMQKDVSKIDPLCDKADENLSKAAALQSNNSEITTVQGMVLTARMQADMSRGMTLGPKSSGMFQAALSQQPTGNPRAMMNMAQSLFYTPEAFGGSKSKAIEMMEKSLASYDTFKPESMLHPNWGKAYVEKILGEWKASK
jgi:hypothetical protein